MAFAREKSVGFESARTVSFRSLEASAASKLSACNVASVESAVSSKPRACASLTMFLAAAASASGVAGGGGPKHFFVAGDEVTVFVKVTDNLLGGFANLTAKAQGPHLPGEVVSEISGLGEEVFEGRTLDILHFTAGAVAGIQIILEERAKINFLEGIFLFRRDRSFFSRSFGRAVAVFLFAADFVDQRDGLFELLENGILHHLGVDHVLELEFIEREDRDHLNQARGKDLALREFDA